MSWSWLGRGPARPGYWFNRIAYLVRCCRERPESIIALAYNRHAAVQIRQRLHELIGDDAQGVLVMTLHSLAMAPYRRNLWPGSAAKRSWR